jgi:hypothetical protein
MKIATKARRHKGEKIEAKLRGREEEKKKALLKNSWRLGAPRLGGKVFIVSGRRRAVMTNCQENSR